MCTNHIIKTYFLGGVDNRILYSRPGGDETANKFIGDVTISGSSLFSAASRWCPVEGGRPADLKSVIEGGKAFLNPDMCESTDHIFCQSQPVPSTGCHSRYR